MRGFVFLFLLTKTSYFLKRKILFCKKRKTGYVLKLHLSSCFLNRKVLFCKKRKIGHVLKLHLSSFISSFSSAPPALNPKAAHTLAQSFIRNWSMVSLWFSNPLFFLALLLYTMLDFCGQLLEGVEEVDLKWFYRTFLLIILYLPYVFNL